VRTTLDTQMWADTKNFYVKQTLQAWDNNELVFEKTWSDSPAR